MLYVIGGIASFFFIEKIFCRKFGKIINPKKKKRAIVVATAVKKEKLDEVIHERNETKKEIE